MGGHIALLTLAPIAVARTSSGSRSPLEHPCSRNVGREVRKMVDEEFIRLPLKQNGIRNYVLPDACPFKEESNIWYYHEIQKKRKRLGGQATWECGICGKKFKSEHYLDLHMEKKHMDKAIGKVCLADYCELFNLCVDSRGLRRGKNDKCDEAAQSRARKLCDEALTLCFPLASPAKLINIELRRNVCAMMSCEVKEHHNLQQSASLVGTFPLMLGLFFIAGVMFLCVMCCVDYSEDIVHALVSSRLASVGFLRNFIRTRNRVQTAVGVRKARQI